MVIEISYKIVTKLTYKERKNDIPVYIGDDFLFYYGKNYAYESIILVCPKCLKKGQLIKMSKNDVFHFDRSHDPFGSDTRSLEIDTKSDFDQHITTCKVKDLKEGINKTTTDYLRTLGQGFNGLSQLETGYFSIAITESTYIYSLNGFPISYIAFYPSGDSIYCWLDAYTIPKDRGKGYASTLFEYAINDLSIDVNELLVSFPVSDAGKPLLLKFAKKKVIPMAIVGGGYDIEDLKENWSEIMKMY